ncbi:MAG: ABC transporter permease [Rhodobacteraceae bacterium]|nr:ABC transporter permease [Paracoccaceae bacterium]
MVNFVVRRLAFMVVILVGVSFLTFLIVNVLPGDVATTILGDFASPEQVEALRERLDLDRPVLQRYAEWAAGMVGGDFGVSLKSNQPIGPILWNRLANSLVLAAMGMAVAIPIGIALGVVTAVHRDSLLDRAITATVVVIFALPEYVTGLALIIVFSLEWNLLPASSLVLPGQSLWANPMTLILPVAVVALGMLAYLCQVTRASMIAALNSGYVRTAVLKGLTRRRIVVTHALRNAMIPTLAEIGLGFGYSLGGLVVIETVFSYPGIGQFLVQSIQNRDIPGLQAGVLVVAAAYGIGNLVADVGSLALNPRLRS